MFVIYNKEKRDYQIFQSWLEMSKHIDIEHRISFNQEVKVNAYEMRDTYPYTIVNKLFERIFTEMDTVFTNSNTAGYMPFMDLHDSTANRFDRYTEGLISRGFCTISNIILMKHTITGQFTSYDSQYRVDNIFKEIKERYVRLQTIDEILKNIED